MLLKVKIGDEKVIELSRDIKHFMQCLNLILDYLMTVSIKKQILILILAAFSLNGACGMLDPKVDAAVKGLSPLNWPLTVNDLELWNKENLVVAKNEKELLAHYMRYYHAKSSSLKNEFYDGFLSRFWGYFVSCVAYNPFYKQEISVFDVAYNHSFDMEYFYFLYGLPGGNAWSVDSKKIDEIRTNFYTMIKAYPKLKDYMTPEMYKYHPLMFANKVFPPRLEVCVNRSGKVFAQLQEAQSFNEDPLNKAKGLKYQFQYEGTLNRRLAYKLYDTLIRKDGDVSQYVYEYSFKGAKK